MKRIVKIAIALCLCLSLVSCSKNEPQKVVDGFLNAVKHRDFKKAAQYYGADIDELSDSFDELSEQAESVSPAVRKMLNKFIDKLTGFEYDILQTKIDGDKAEVNVRIKTYDFGSLVSKFMSDYLLESIGLAFSGADQTEVERKIVDLLNDMIDEMKDKDYVETTTFYLTKKDNKWIIDKLPNTVLNVLMGNLYSVLDDVEDMFDF